jgi:Holliday junction DNA helicase RuvB
MSEPTPTPATELNAVVPGVLERFIGNRPIVERVKVALEAAWNDQVKFPNTLMVGPPGLGKTLMASIIAKEMGCELSPTSAVSFISPYFALKRPRSLHYIGFTIRR